MTIVSKLTFRGRLRVVRDQLLVDLRRQLESGASRAALEITEKQVGKRLGVAVSLLCSEIENAGYRVLRANTPGWSHAHRCEIIVSARREYRLI